MSGVATLLLQLTLWVATAYAFFPFIPNDQCDPSGHCGSPGSGPQRTGSGVISLDIIQKPKDSNHGLGAEAVQVSQAISKLTGKYGERKQLDTQRAGSYQISEPVKPTAPNSAGIYQFGPDYSYFIQARVGSTEQPFYMLLDTGAANTWLMGSDCESEACKMHSVFDPASSKTWRTEKKAFAIYYGTGDLTGTVGQDTASLAGLKFNLSFGLANYTHDQFKYFAFDGILGLSPGPSATGTFLQTLKEDKVLDSLVFGVSLNRDSDGHNDGQITFGGIDETKYTGDITYTKVPSPDKESGEWNIPMDSPSFNGKSAGVKGRLAAIDTGTSFIFAPPEDLEALFKHVPGASSYANGEYIEYKVPCDTKHSIDITFSGVTYAISPRDWIAGSDGNCISRIYGYTFKENTWLLGDTFLKNVYTVFDADKMRIGFAAKPPPPPKPTLTTGTGAATTQVSAPTKPSATDDGSSRPIMPGSSSEETSGAGSGPGSGSGPGAVETANSPAPTENSSGRQLTSSSFLFSLCIVAVIAVLE
ncbi:hypothetical protein VTK26DRAFT_293 [Humicola hyalothermophila]